MDERVLSWADDAYAIGSELASITGLYGPQLEENLALGSIAQDHLGHARLLYKTIADDDTAVDRLIFTRPASEYRTSLLAGEWRAFDWPFVCVRGLCYALADTIRAQANDDPALADLAATIARDTAVHREHWAEWMTNAARGGESARFEATLASIVPLMRDFFADAEPTAAAAMLSRWFDELRAACAKIGISVPTAPAQQHGIVGSGRSGRHGEAFCALVAEAASVYAAYPGVRLA
ncbi:MAG: hypothetical protein NVSMB64_29560 [Candidatus Velthaea sp.]